MLNSIVLVGRLTKDPQLVTTNSGNNVTNFTIAFNQGKNPDGTEATGFIDCTTFGKQAEVCSEWLSKGDKIAIRGRLNHRKFTREDGSKGSIHQVLVDDVEFIDLIKTAEEKEHIEPDEVEIPFEPAPEVKVTPKPQNTKPVAKTTRSRR